MMESMGLAPSEAEPTPGDDPAPNELERASMAACWAGVGEGGGAKELPPAPAGRPTFI